jgi:hypothetical protein
LVVHCSSSEQERVDQRPDHLQNRGGTGLVHPNLYYLSNGRRRAECPDSADRTCVIGLSGICHHRSTTTHYHEVNGLSLNRIPTIISYLDDQWVCQLPADGARLAIAAHCFDHRSLTVRHRSHPTLNFGNIRNRNDRYLRTSQLPQGPRNLRVSGLVGDNRGLIELASIVICELNGYSIDALTLIIK